MPYQPYTPRRPVRSFLDLEVYQFLLASSVVIFKKVAEDLEAPKSKAKANPEITDELKNDIVKTLLNCALDLPKQIAKAHSLRFSNLALAMKILDETMNQCNRVVVYLELYRDLCNKKIEIDFFEQTCKNYIRNRFKLMHLLRSWEKFKKSNQGET